MEQLIEAELEVSDAGVRRNRYYVHIEEIEDLTEKTPERLRWLWRRLSG